MILALVTLFSAFSVQADALDALLRISESSECSSTRGHLTFEDAAESSPVTSRSAVTPEGSGEQDSGYTVDLPSDMECVLIGDLYHCFSKVGPDDVYPRRQSFRICIVPAVPSDIPRFCFKVRFGSTKDGGVLVEIVPGWLTFKKYYCEVSPNQAAPGEPPRHTVNCVNIGEFFNRPEWDGQHTVEFRDGQICIIFRSGERLCGPLPNIPLFD